MQPPCNSSMVRLASAGGPEPFRLCVNDHGIRSTDDSGRDLPMEHTDKFLLVFPSDPLARSRVKTVDHQTIVSVAICSIEMTIKNAVSEIPNICGGFRSRP